LIIINITFFISDMDQTKKEEFLGKISGSQGMKKHFDDDGLSETASLGNMIRNMFDFDP